MGCCCPLKAINAGLGQTQIAHLTSLDKFRHGPYGIFNGDSGIDPMLVIEVDVLDAQPRQRVIEVTEAVTIGSDRFDFAGEFRGLEVLPEKGSLIGHDDGNPVVTPYDNCVLIMPSRRLVKGQTAVRLGRYVD